MRIFETKNRMKLYCVAIFLLIIVLLFYYDVFFVLYIFIPIFFLLNKIYKCYLINFIHIANEYALIINNVNNDWQ